MTPRTCRWIACCAVVGVALPLHVVARQLFPADPLEIKGDLARHMVDGAHRFLDQKIEHSEVLRAANWPTKTKAEHRAELARILGTTEPRTPRPTLIFISHEGRRSLVARAPHYEIHAVRWPVLEGMEAEGLLLKPTEGHKPTAHAVVIPDADQSPEALAGLDADTAPAAQSARRLAEAGCQVLIPTLIDRTTRNFSPRRKHIRLSQREFLHRSAFLMGRTLQGYEIQKVLAALDCLPQDGQERTGLAGWGEGALLAKHAAALDERVDTVLLSGLPASGNQFWDQPLERNLFNYHTYFDDKRLRQLIQPRQILVEKARGPEVIIDAQGAAPGRLESLHDGEPGSSKTFEDFLQTLQPGKHQNPGKTRISGTLPDAQARQQRTFRQIDQYTQRLLQQSHLFRDLAFQPDATSLQSFAQSTQPHRERFAKNVIGQFNDQRLPPNPRARKVYDTDTWTGHEVLLDVFPDLCAYGVLLLPKNLKPGEKRPVVVCQHGLEGRPRDTIEGDHRAYHDFAAKLCERGYVVFAPQNPYLFGDRFRSLQRKANPLGKTLFSLIVPQHRQIVDWLGTLPFTDSNRIAFYGLSYGGKTAMRVPALVEGYCLSICSADFNEWIRKTGSTQPGDDRYSYPFTGEYEIFEYNLGHTFNYAEMAALIAPRPFMVERGHFDGVAPDEWVAAEYAKVRHLYARLGIPERTRIEWFAGPHTINAQGTFDFLDKWLKL